MLIEGLQTYLAANAGLQVQLGTASQRSDSTTGIFPTLAPDQCPMPYIVCQQITGNPLQESMAGTGRLQTSRWRFSCYGTTYKNAKKLAEALKDALFPLNGVLTAGSVQVQGSWLKLEADDAEPIPHGTIYATHVDFEINFLDLH
jgi:hypothetical protein